MSDDFVTPEPFRLTLADGQFVDIRTRLSHGETEDMYHVSAEGGRRVVRTAKIDAYLLGWSLTKGGTPVPMSPEMPALDRLNTIRALTAERAVEIYHAILAHEQAMRDARAAAQKKILAGAPSDDKTSNSPSAPNSGPSDGSEPSTSTITPSSSSC
jgi:hypothetical protein